MSHTSTASTLSEVLAIAARMWCVDEYRLFKRAGWAVLNEQRKTFGKR
jgi:hypothetical protein